MTKTCHHIWSCLWLICFFTVSLYAQEKASILTIEQLITQGKWLPALKNARQFYKEVHQSDATNIEKANACLLYGKAHQLLSKHDSAIIFFRKAIEYYRQNPIGKNLATATIHAYLGNSLSAIRDRIASLKAIENALAFFKQNDMEQSNANIYTRYVFGVWYARKGDFENAHHQLDTALNISLASLSVATITSGLIHSLKGYLNWKQQDFKKAIAHFEAAEQVFLKLGGSSSDYLGGLYINLGGCSADMGNHQKAIPYYEKALTILKSQNKNHPYLHILYNNLGNAYGANGEFALAIDYLQQAIDIAPNIRRVGVRYNNLGNTYLRVGELEKAIPNFQKAIEKLLPFKGLLLEELARPYHNLAICFREQKKLEEAIAYEKIALSLRKEKWKEPHLDIARSFTELGELSNKNGNLKTAISYLDSALQIQAKVIPTRKHFEIANTYLSQADNYYQLGNKKKWQHYLDSAYYATGYQEEDLAAIQAKLEYLQIVRYEAIIYHQLAKTNSSIPDALKAHQLYKKATQALNFWRTSLLEENSKLVMIQQNYALFDEGLQNALLLYEMQNPKDINVLNTAFSFAEQSKALLLLEVLQKTKALTFTDLPFELLQKEKQLKEEIASLKKEVFIYHSKNGVEKDEAIVEKNEKILTLNRTFHQLQQQIAKLAPDYYQARQSIDIAQISEVQAYLKNQPNAALIEYFFSANTLYVFGITSDLLQTFSVPLPPSFFQDLKDWRKILSTPPAGNEGAKEKIETFTKFAQLGHTLYQTLLKDVLQHIKTKHLIIVPDGMLGYIPFEILIGKTSNEKKLVHNDYRKLNYLFLNHPISYEYSASLLINSSFQVKHSQQLYAGFAPSYGEDKTFASNHLLKTYSNKNQLIPLKFNKNEIEETTLLMDGEAFLGEKATEFHFKNIVSKADILHLSMHGLVNDQAPLYSHLVFTNTIDTLEDNRLYIYELYNLRLRANLAVLSACDTGIGEWQRGEGIMSLSRAFKYAGCPNIVMSLWAANEWTSKNLMLNFFENLKAQKRKDVALQLARQNYLFNNKEVAELFTHPFYWANFVLIGGGEPLQFHSKFNIYKWLAIILIIFLAILFLAKDRSKKNN